MFLSQTSELANTVFCFNNDCVITTVFIERTKIRVQGTCLSSVTAYGLQ